MSKIQDLLKNSFITVNSTPRGEYTVQIQPNNLAEAHLLHRMILAIRNGAHLVKENDSE